MKRGHRKEHSKIDARCARVRFRALPMEGLSFCPPFLLFARCAVPCSPLPPPARVTRIPVQMEAESTLDVVRLRIHQLVSSKGLRGRLLRAALCLVRGGDFIPLRPLEIIALHVNSASIAFAMMFDSVQPDFQR